MLHRLSKALLGFACLICASNSYANYSPSREVVKYIFLFFDRLATQPQLSTSLSSRITENINQQECIYPQDIQLISSKYRNPTKIITEISKLVNENCPVINIEKNDNSLLDLSEYNLYVLFSSEWSNDVESSFGHVRLALMKNDEYMFSPTFTFSVYDFYSTKSSESTLSKYLKAALTSVDGRFSKDFFFESYYNTVSLESRKIHRFKVNMDIKGIEEIYSYILQSLNKPQKYNFFFDNCSTKSLDLLAEFSHSPKLKGLSPSKQLNNLLMMNVIEYTDTFSPINKEEKELTFRKNNLNSVIYDNLSLISLGTRDISISFYESPRPIDSSIKNFSRTNILKFESNYHENNQSLTLINMHSTSGINEIKPSLRLKIGYNTENFLYSGIGYIHKNIGFDSMLGYSDNYKWSSFSSINFKYNLVDLSIGLQTNTDDSNTSIDFNFYITDRLSLFIGSDNNVGEFKLNYLF